MQKHSENPSPRAISQLERVFSCQLKKQLRRNKLNLTVEEFRILFYLWFDDGLTQNEIAEKAFKEKSLITKTINSLEQKELIVRKRKEHDKRNKQIILTSKAKKIEKRALECANTITTIAEKDISDQELNVFFNVINKMEKNLI